MNQTPDPPQQIKPPHGGGIVLFRPGPNGPEFLLLRSRWGRHWSLPKGHRSRNEPILKTALRETEEETGITQEHIRFINGVDDEVSYTLKRPTKNCPTGVKRVRFYLGMVERGTKVKLSKEHTEYKWVKYMAVLRMLQPCFFNLISRCDGLAIKECR